MVAFLVIQLSNTTPEVEIAVTLTTMALWPRLASSALILSALGHSVGVTAQLNVIKPCHLVQQRPHAAPLAQQSQRMRESHLMIEFCKTNHVTTATAAVAVEKIL